MLISAAAIKDWITKGYLNRQLFWCAEEKITGGCTEAFSCCISFVITYRKRAGGTFSRLKK